MSGIVERVGEAEEIQHMAPQKKASFLSMEKHPIMSTYEKACPSCGALHRVIGSSVPFRDSDFPSCKACGEELYRWNGGVVFRSALIEVTEKSEDTSC